MNDKEKVKIATRVSVVSILLNIFLCLSKITAGLIGKSTAIIADGIHSMSDVFSTIIVIIGIKLSTKPADKEHPYGHEKLEPITAKLLSAILFLTGIFICKSSITTIITKNYMIPSKITAYIALLSVVLKEWMYLYTMKNAKIINSTSLKADAFHHKSDALSSITTLIGIIGSRLKYPILDPIASLFLCIFIFNISIKIYKSSIKQLIDHCADSETLDLIEKKTLSIPGVKRLDDLKTRMHGSKLYVDIEISVDKDLSTEKAHFIAEKVHNEIELCDVDIIHCMVHVNPYYYD
ncbi:cation diffusion facilitator family transporter [Clostridium oceanicum]|uniref:Cation diffusion facilitator family transporter n=1 Tax=Clostridium oceanicum TaxID=1543 RepID=A0ABN1JII6_9CLOT